MSRSVISQMREVVRDFFQPTVSHSTNTCTLAGCSINQQSNHAKKLHHLLQIHVNLRAQPQHLLNAGSIPCLAMVSAQLFLTARHPSIGLQICSPASLVLRDGNQHTKNPDTNKYFTSDWLWRTSTAKHEAVLNIHGLPGLGARFQRNCSSATKALSFAFPSCSLASLIMELIINTGSLITSHEYDPWYCIQLMPLPPGPGCSYTRALNASLQRHLRL